MKQKISILFLLFVLFMTACGSNNNRQLLDMQSTNQQSIEQQSNEHSTEQPTEVKTDTAGSIDDDQEIHITTKEGSQIVFRLNDSPAANSFYDQLPLSIEIDNYGDKEKIFYPPEKLNVGDTPMAEGPAGTLAYFEPWGNIAVFYGECGQSTGLYELGEAVNGIENISKLEGEILIETSEAIEVKQTDTSGEEVSAVRKMNVQIGDATFKATLENNATADELVAIMKESPITINMSDYSGFEKIGELGTELTTNNRQTTTQSGDIVLYNGNQIVIFYGSNSWSYTRLGKMDDLTGFTDALGSGDVFVTFSVSE